MKQRNVRKLILGLGSVALLSACGGEGGSTASAPGAEIARESTPPTIVESFVLEDVVGKPMITFAEFENVTIATVRETDSGRSESVRVEALSDGSKLVRRASGQGVDWSRPYGDGPVTLVAIEWDTFRRYQKMNLFFQLRDCRSSRLHARARRSIDGAWKPVLLSLQARRRADARRYEILLALDPKSGRWTGVTVDKGPDLALDEPFYLAVSPSWVIDGEASSSILGTPETVELSLRCDDARARRPRDHDGELSLAADQAARFGRTFSIYNLVPRRSEMQVSTLSELIRRFPYQPSDSEMNSMFSELTNRTQEGSL